MHIFFRQHTEWEKKTEIYRNTIKINFKINSARSAKHTILKYKIIFLCRNRSMSSLSFNSRKICENRLCLNNHLYVSFVLLCCYVAEKLFSQPIFFLVSLYFSVHSVLFVLCTTRCCCCCLYLLFCYIVSFKLIIVIATASFSLSLSSSS